MRHAKTWWNGNVDRDSAPIDTVFYDEDIPLPDGGNNSSSNLNPYEQVADSSAALPVPDNSTIWDKMRNLDEKLNSGAEEFVKSNPITKFLAKAGQSAANTITNGGALQDNYDTNSWLANGAADVLGTGLGFMEKIPGTDFSIGNAMNKVIGQPTEEVLAKAANRFGIPDKLANLSNSTGNKVAKYALDNLPDYTTRALKTGAEFGGYEGLSNAIQGKDVREGIAEGMGQGMLWGAGGKALGDFTHTIKGIGKVKVLGDDGNRIKFQDENGNVQDMNKTIFNNTVQSLDTANPSYANTNLDNVFKPHEIVKNTPIENEMPLPNTNTPLESKLPQNTPMNESTPIDKVTNRINELDNKPLEVAYSKIEDPNTPDSYSMDVPVPKQEDIIRPDFNPETAPTQQIVSSKQKSNFKDIWENFKTHFLNVNEPTKKVDEKTHVLATNTANAGGIVDAAMTKFMPDIEGKPIGESLAKVIKPIPKKQYKDFMEYAMQRHNIARAGEEKPIYFREVDGKESPYTPSESAARVQLLEQQHPEWKQTADNLTNWIDTFMQEWGVKTGVVNGDLYKALREKYPDYLPSNREFNDLEDFIPSGSGNSKGFINQNTPIKKAKGSQRNIIDPTENIMNLVNRTIRTAKYNEVGQRILNKAMENPEGMKHLAEIVPEEAMPKTKTDNIVSVLVDGNPTYMKINDKNLLGALTKINKSNVGDVEAAARKANNLFKSLITTKNPLFAFSNAVKDLPTYLVNSKENNPLKGLWNLGGAYKDILTNSPNYKQYKGVGGGGANFFNSEKPYKSAKELNKKGILPMLNNGVESFNNFFENAPRLAEFKNTLKKTGDVNQALYDANDVTVNFAKGGDYVKFLDSFTPYLNAGVQGLEKFTRQGITRPLATLLKGATVVTAPTLLLDHYNKDNKDYQALDNRTKDNNYLFPKKDGTFLKIPKSRELGVVFSALIQRIIRQRQGDPNAFKDFGNTAATNFSPASPIENNILWPYIEAKYTNKDFANRSIVPQSMIQDQRSPYLQYDEKTSNPAIWLAQQLKNTPGVPDILKSPKKIDFIVKSYTGVIGQFLQPLTTESTKTGSKTGDLLSPLTSKFSADPLYNNQAINDFYDNMGKTKTAASDNNIVNKINSKTTTHEEHLASEFTKANKSIGDLSKASFEALQKGDMNKVKELRQQIIDIATSTNKYMPSQKNAELPVPASEIKANVEGRLKGKTSTESTQIRKEIESIDKSDMSAEERTKRLNDLLEPAKNAPVKKATKTTRKKKTTKYTNW